MPPRKRKQSDVGETNTDTFYSFDSEPVLERPYEYGPPTFSDHTSGPPRMMGPIKTPWPSFHTRYQWINPETGSVRTCSCAADAAVCNCVENVATESGTAAASESSTVNKSVGRMYHTPYYRKSTSDRTLLDLLNDVQSDADNYLMGESQLCRMNRTKKKYLHAIRLRINGKKGRVRGNMNGKRQNQYARTVIVCDPYIDIDECLLPHCIANVLSKTIRVTDNNVKELTRLMLDRKLIYVINTEGEMIRMKGADPLTYTLKPGYVIERQLMDGDVIVANRQPTLHKMSMMAFRVRINKNKNIKTLGLPIAVTPPFNADFDGDEMNLEVPCSEEAESEAYELLMSRRHMITVQSSKPIIAAKHNLVLGFHLLSRPDTFLEKADFFSLLMHFENTWNWNSSSSQHSAHVPPALPKMFCRSPAMPGGNEMELLEPTIRVKDKNGHWKCLYSGSLLIESFLPSDFSMNMDKISSFTPFSKTKEKEKKETCRFNWPCPVIHRGGWIGGCILGEHVGNTQGSIFQHFLNQYKDCAVTAYYLSGMQRIINEYMLIRGHSANLSDVVDTHYDEHQAVLRKVSTWIEEAEQRENPPLEDIQWMRDFTVQQMKNAIVRQADENELRKSYLGNGTWDIIRSGTKGSSMNLANMSVCLGQQYFDIKPDRCSLPFFNHPKGRLRMSSSFVTSSYLDGLNPMEFFYHTRCGRYSASATTLLTADCGYVYRQVYTHTDRYVVDWLGHVADQRQNILQMAFAGDDSNPEHMEYVEYRSYRFSNEKDFLQYNANVTTVEELNRLVRDWTIVKETERCIQRHNNVQKMFQSPLHFPRILYKWYTSSCNDTRVSPKISVQEWRLATLSWMEHVLECHLSSPCAMQSQRPASFFIQVLARDYLSTQSFYSFSNGWTRQALTGMLTEMTTRWMSTRLEQGRPIGSESSQSIGEPTTQMTMKQFHEAGQSSGGLGGAVTHLKHILAGTVNRNNPSMCIVLKPEITTKQQAQKVANDMVSRSMSYFVRNVSWCSLEDWKQNHTPENPLIRLFTDLPSSSQCILQWSLHPSRVQAYGGLVNVVKSFFRSLSAWFGFGVNVLWTSYARWWADISTTTVWIHFAEWDSTFPQLSKWVRTKDELLKQWNVSGYSFFIQQVHEDLKQLKVFGMDNIREATVGKNVEKLPNGDMRWLIRTRGIQYTQVMAHPLVDASHSHMNLTKDVTQHYGIQACRQFLLHSLEETMSRHVNSRHLGLLADAMTRFGYLISVSRQGLLCQPNNSKQTNTEPFENMSFEMPLDRLFQAAVFRATDPLKSIMSNVFMGTIAPIGTGTVHLYPRTVNEEEVPAQDRFKTFFPNPYSYKTKKNRKALTAFLPYHCGGISNTAQSLLAENFETGWEL